MGTGAREGEMALYLGAATTNHIWRRGLVVTLQIEKLQEGVGLLSEISSWWHSGLHENQPTRCVSSTSGGTTLRPVD